jgi:hypothetical protein
VGGGPSADKSRESGVIRAIDARGGARDASGNACRIKHQMIMVMFAATGMKDLKKRFIARCVIPPQGRDDYFACRFILAQHNAGQLVIMILLSF